MQTRSVQGMRGIRGRAVLASGVVALLLAASGSGTASTVGLSTSEGRGGLTPAAAPGRTGSPGADADVNQRGYMPQRTGDEGEEGERLTEEARRQAPLTEAKAELEQAAAETGVDGLATVNPDYGANHLHLYWKGELPVALREAVERVRTRFGVTVHDAPYSWTELDAQIRKILRLIEEDKALGFISAVAMEPDVSGIKVLVSDPSHNTEHAASAIRSAIEPSVALRFVFEDWAADIKPTVAGSRWDDQPPFIGGAVIEKYWLGLFLDGRCSSAFTVRNSANTVRGVMTARHCGENEDWYTPGGNYVGSSNLLLDGKDIMGIVWPTNTPGYPGFSGRIYTGGHTSSTMGAISGSGSSALGSLYCLSGGYSGTMCSNRVIERNVYPSGLGGPMFITQQTEGTAAAGHGDSGGAAYYLGTSTRSARGVISAIDSNRQRTCRGIPGGDGRFCSDTVFHVELQPALNALGLQVITS